jgi:hypothetical protein
MTDSLMALAAVLETSLREYGIYRMLRPQLLIRIHIDHAYSDKTINRWFEDSVFVLSSPGRIGLM